MMDFPVILSDENPHVYAYSLCSSVAEKFEAIVSLAYDNSRFKDYYDLYVLATTHDFGGSEMVDAVRETFKNRHSSLNEIVAFEDGFADDSLRQSRWNAFVKKKKSPASYNAAGDNHYDSEVHASRCRCREERFKAGGQLVA